MLGTWKAGVRKLGLGKRRNGAMVQSSKGLSQSHRHCGAGIKARHQSFVCQHGPAIGCRGPQEGYEWPWVRPLPQMRTIPGKCLRGWGRECLSPRAGIGCHITVSTTVDILENRNKEKKIKITPDPNNLRMNFDTYFLNLLYHTDVYMHMTCVYTHSHIHPHMYVQKWIILFCILIFSEYSITIFSVLS